MFCRGHNEIDDPSFTQPMMYQVIENRASVPDKYADSLVTRGVVTQDELTKDTADHTAFLNEELKVSDNTVPHMTHLERHWKGLVQASEDKITSWDTGICTGTPRLYFAVKIVTGYPHTHSVVNCHEKRSNRSSFPQKVNYRGLFLEICFHLAVSDEVSFQS